MAEGARVESIDSLRTLKIALIKFRESANVALGDADSELQRMHLWLEHEQYSYWQGQVRKRSELLTRAKEALRAKKVYGSSSDGMRVSVVDEEKAVRVAQAKLDEAEERRDVVKRWARDLQREIQSYKGGVQHLASAVQVDIPAAVAHLESLSLTLDQYIDAPTDAVSTAAGPEQNATTAPDAAMPASEPAPKATAAQETPTNAAP